MKRFLVALGILSTVLVSSPLAHAAGEGLHPWDERARHTRTRVLPRFSDYDYYSNPLFSQTHALHPFHRRNYGRGFYYPRDILSRWAYLTLYDEGPSFPRCDNYSYQRSDYRMVPSGYKCQ